MATTLANLNGEVVIHPLDVRPGKADRTIG
jgi:hypothetical protein